MRIALCTLLVATLAGGGCARRPALPAADPPPRPPVRQVAAASTADVFWAKAKREIYATPAALLAQDLAEARSGLRFAKLMHGNPALPQVALTFDDGPHPRSTPQILAILKREGVRATFFVVGKMAEKYPDLVRAEVQAGHLLGNHSYHHLDLVRIPERQVLAEWQACQDVVLAITGRNMSYCRPPGGDYDRAVIQAAAGLGLTTVLWTDDPGDYARPGEHTIEVKTLDKVHNGGIILLHDGVQQTIDVLPQVISRLKAKGYKFVTVDRMQPATRLARVL